MATVYKAYDTRLERDVAIKIIRSEAFPPNQLERILKRFEREAKSLARLSHTNIIKVIDYGEHEGAPYLVMEYLAGGTLKQRLGKPIPWQDAVKLILPIAEALEYAHEQKIIHRDIKPSNILLTQKGQPMLTDFGIAKILESEETFTLTGTGIGVGTPEYMAPEQWTGQTTPQSDIYSLGVVLYEMITSRKPYMADTPAAILLKQANDPLPRPKDFVSNLPDTVEKVLLKSLAKIPKDRYADMPSFADALEGLVVGKQTTDTQLSRRSKPNEETTIAELPYNTKIRLMVTIPPSISPRKWAWGISVIIIGAIILILFLFSFFKSLTEIRIPTSTASAISTEAFTLMPIFTPTSGILVADTPIPSTKPSPMAQGGGTGQFAFASDRIGIPQVYLANSDGSSPTVITNVPEGTCQPTWSPDGMQLVFTSPCSGPDDVFENSDLYSINLDGTGLKLLLPESGGGYDPAWSPDGKRIAFTSRRTGRPSIFVLDIATNTVTLLFESTGNFSETRSPAWSPFNNRILFVATRGITEIWAMTDTGKNAIQLVYSGMEYVDFDPIWSPDGQFVQFSQRLVSPSSVWLAQLAYEDRELMTAKRLSFSPSWIENIEYSPDGLWLLYESVGEDGNRDIWLMTIDGESITRITSDPGADFDPTWQP